MYKRTRNRKFHILWDPKWQSQGTRKYKRLRREGLGKQRHELFMFFWAPLQVTLLSLMLASKLQAFRIKP